MASVTFDEVSATAFIKRYSSYTHLFNNLTSEKRLSFDGARWLFGAYSGYAATIFNLPVGVLASFGVSLFPIVASAKTVGDYSKINKMVSRATTAVTILLIPCSIVLCIFSKEILYLLFKNTASSLMLSFMAPTIITSALVQLSVTTLHASGKIMTPFFHGLICSIVRIILSVLLMSVPKINIIGTIISSFASGLLYLILNIYALKKDGIYMLSLKSFLKTFLAGIAMILCIMLISPPIAAHFSSIFITTGICVGASFVVYIAVLYILGIKVYTAYKRNRNVIFRFKLISE